MTLSQSYTANAPSRTELDQTTGPLVVEFGTDWCGFCKSSQPHIAKAFAEHPNIRHVKIEDGQGRRLGRSFDVKLWPTLVFMRDGLEVTRIVRPRDSADLLSAFNEIL